MQSHCPTRAHFDPDIGRTQHLEGGLVGHVVPDEHHGGCRHPPSKAASAVPLVSGVTVSSTNSLAIEDRYTGNVDGRIAHRRGCPLGSGWIVDSPRMEHHCRPLRLDQGAGVASSYLLDQSPGGVKCRALIVGQLEPTAPLGTPFGTMTAHEHDP